jgi:hypothetical protein
MRISLANRFPKKEQIIPVYAVGVTILYSWSLFTAVDSSWLLFFNIIDIFKLFTYILAGAFLESLILIGSLLFISLFFSKIFLDSKFILYGSILTITFLGSLIYIHSQTWTMGLLENIDKWIKFFFTSTIIALFLSEKIKIIQKWILVLADICIVFLYMYIPISIISIIFIFIRNLG